MLSKVKARFETCKIDNA